QRLRAARSEEAARREHAKGMAERIKRTHPEEPQREEADQSQQRIDLEQREDRMTEPGGDFSPAVLRKRSRQRSRAGKIEDAGQHREKDEHRKAARPLQQAAPENNRSRHRTDIGKDRRAVGSESRDCLKVSVGERRDGAAQIKRQGGEGRHHDPDQRRREKGLAPAENGEFAPHGEQQPATDEQRDERRNKKIEGK